MNIKFLENKKIYISPYNDLTIELAAEIKNIKSCKVIGFIDNNKIMDKVFKAENITEEADVILIFSPNYIYEIYDNLKQKLRDKTIYYEVSNLCNKFQFKIIPESSKNIVTLGNCQADHMGQLLKIMTKDYFTLKSYLNFRKDLNKQELLKSIKKADVLIYQPLSDFYDELSFKNIQKITKKYNTKLITFPYIYNDGIYSLEFGIGKICGEEVILNLFKDGLSQEQIISKYLSQEIDFDLLNRFSESLQIMRERESLLDIRLTDFLEKNYTKQKLFYGYNHPTNVVFLEAIKQIIKKLDFREKNIKCNEKNLPRLCDTLSPISPYDKRIHKYKFESTYSCGWTYQGVAIIEMIISRYLMNNNTNKDICNG